MLVSNHFGTLVDILEKWVHQEYSDTASIKEYYIHFGVSCTRALCNECKFAFYLILAGP
jgi:hypothetical protein